MCDRATVQRRLAPDQGLAQVERSEAERKRGQQEEN